METLKTAGEIMTPYFTKALDYFNKTEAFKTAMQTNPLEFASRWVTGLGSAYLATKSFQTAWNSKSTLAKVALYTASISFAAVAAYEVTGALYGRVSLGENYIPVFHPHDEL